MSLPLLIALQFLTRMPVRLSAMPSPAEQGRSLLWYPVVGLVIGALLMLGRWLASDLPAPLLAALLLLLWVWLSGALHLDGLADTADAWVGGFGDRERTLAIMKDPRCGPIGVTAVVVVLLLKYAALVSVLEAELWWALLLAPWIGRTLLPLLLLTTAYVRPGGLGDILSKNLPRGWLPPVLLSHALAMLLLGNGAWLGVAGALALFWVWRRKIRLRLGGTTGDTAGALVEPAEALVLVLMICINLPFIS
jgi:adenosylcobinamide-GDP ribazoletransferase